MHIMQIGEMAKRLADKVTSSHNKVTWSDILIQISDGGISAKSISWCKEIIEEGIKCHILFVYLTLMEP